MRLKEGFSNTELRLLNDLLEHRPKYHELRYRISLFGGKESNESWHGLRRSTIKAFVHDEVTLDEVAGLMAHLAVNMERSGIFLPEWHEEDFYAWCFREAGMPMPKAQVVSAMRERVTRRVHTPDVNLDQFATRKSQAQGGISFDDGTCLHIDDEVDFNDVKGRLTEEGWKEWLRNEVFAAIESGDLYDVTVLIEQGAPLDDVNEEGQTPIQVAALRKNQNIVDFILESQSGNSVS